jgi:hypothetical protein
MALQTEGPISVRDINIELGLLPETPFSFDSLIARTLADKLTGPISLSDFLGKADVQVLENNVDRIGGSIYELFGSPTEAGKFEFQNTAIIGSSTADQFRTGVFPAGSELVIVNTGTVSGFGGAGGSLDPAVSPNNKTDDLRPQLNGDPGGPAILFEFDCEVDNTNGVIQGGGGGGGAASRASNLKGYREGTVGGGGGAGRSPGDLGVSFDFVTEDPFTPTVPGGSGTLTSGGNGSRQDVLSSPPTTLTGGDGGDPGQPGSMGQTIGSVPIYITFRFGLGGAPGAAIDKNGNTVTVTGGTIRGPILV